MKSKSTMPPSPRNPANEPLDVEHPAQAAALDGIFMKLYRKADALKNINAEMQKAWDEAALAANKREEEYKREIAELKRANDDLSQREFTLQEELRICHREMGGLRVELKAARFHFSNALDRAEHYIMPEAEADAFESRPGQAKQNAEHLAAVERALRLTPEEVPERAAEKMETLEPQPAPDIRDSKGPRHLQPQRLDARPVRRPTVLPEDE